jgi:hypothetical protein
LIVRTIVPNATDLIGWGEFALQKMAVVYFHAINFIGLSIGETAPAGLG